MEIPVKPIQSPRRLKRIVVLIVLSIAVAAGGWFWWEKQQMDDLVSPGLFLINYTDQDVYASVHYSKFPKPGDGASDGMGRGPGAGGGSLVCCVPIPTIWHPGIQMIVKYRFGDWPEGKEETKVVELPPYPGGHAGSFYLVFHSEAEFELFSTMYGPRHPRWPGRRVEEILPEIN